MIPRSLSCYQTTEGISNVEGWGDGCLAVHVALFWGLVLMPDAALADLSEGWMRLV